MTTTVLSTNDVKAMAQAAVLVIPVLALSYLVADIDKFKVSTLLSSPILKGKGKLQNPELYDAWAPLIFSIFAIAGFSTGLYVIEAPSENIKVWQSAVIFVALGICGFIIIFQLLLSLMKHPLEQILARRKESADKKLRVHGNAIFVSFAVVTLLMLIGVLVNLGYLLYQYAFNTTIGL